MSPAISLAALAVLRTLGYQPPLSVDGIRKAAEQAIGAVPSGHFSLRGVAEYESLWQSFEMVGDSKFRYTESVAGILPKFEGFDGRTAWLDGVAGVPHAMSHSARDLSRIIAYVIDGSWAAPDAPLSFKLLGTSPTETSLDVTCLDGGTPVTLFLDAQSRLPVRLTHWGSDGEDEWTFADYTKEAGWAVPTRITHRGGDENERIVVDSVAVDVGSGPSFGPPRTDDGLAIYDPTISKQLEVKRIGGYLFVHPKLNGRDEGWFFFDTGADCMVIDSRLAEKYRLPAIGSEFNAGVVATSRMSICEGMRFQLGPITLTRPTYYEMDMAPFSAAFGIPVAGICGYDYISRGSFDIDLGKKTIEVWEPGRAPLPTGAKWVPFTFNSNVPCVPCGFAPNHTGFFAVDTGSGSAVDFCSPAVEKYDMLKGREVVSGYTGGAGGAAESKGGTIEWFEFAGHRFEHLGAGFQLTKKGAFASPYFDGNIGEGILRNGRLILDYRRSRLAFAPGAAH